MIIYYLYIKTHRKTGLKYLGQTKQDPFKYRGSGKRWLNHIKKHGYDVDTEILLETSNKEELKETGIYYSNLWNIVQDNTWANIIIENASGGDTITTHPNREQICKKNSETANLRVVNKTHHFLGPEINNAMIAKGTHISMNSEKCRERELTKIKNGTHVFLTDNPSPKRVKDGTHNFLGGKVQSQLNKKLVENGTHHFLNKEEAKKRAEKLISEGRHGSQLLYKCQHCEKQGKGNSMKRWHMDNCRYKS